MRAARSRCAAIVTVLLTLVVVGSGCGDAQPEPAGGGSAASPAATTGQPATTALDGTYRWTLTDDDALAHGTTNDQTPEALALFPTLHTMTLADGRWTLAIRTDTGEAESYTGTYAVDEERLTFTWPMQDAVLTWGYTVGDAGAITLAPVGAADAGDTFVWTTQPWTKIG